MWESAKSKKLLHPHYDDDNGFKGCIVDRSTSPPRVRALVFAYVPQLFEEPNAYASYPSIFARQSEYVLVPVDEELKPIWPFGFQPTGLDWRNVRNSMPADQRKAVEDYVFTEVDFERGSAAVASKDFIPLNHPGGIQSGGFDGAEWRFWRADDVSPAAKEALSNRFEKGGDSVSPPATAHFVRMPWKQPVRPRKSREQNMAVALLLTPVTVPLDAATLAAGLVLAPIVIPAMYMGIIPGPG